jgi:hypothetical protein
VSAFFVVTKIEELPDRTVRVTVRPRKPMGQVFLFQCPDSDRPRIGDLYQARLFWEGPGDDS